MELSDLFFFSSMIVYGEDMPLGKKFIIDSSTIPRPANFYGESKLEAEKLLLELEDENFKVIILRLPMVYGPDCKGNFPQLLKVSQKGLMCPFIKNNRRMIYIDNLCELLKLIIKNDIFGILYPQNTEFVSTVEIVKIVTKYFNRKILFLKIFNPLFFLLSRHIEIINKIFGTKIYDKSLSPDLDKYNKVDFDTSIKECVNAYIKKKIGFQK